MTMLRFIFNVAEFICTFVGLVLIGIVIISFFDDCASFELKAKTNFHFVKEQDENCKV